MGQETYDTREAAQDRIDEISPKVARGQSPATQRTAGNRPLSHYAQPWLDGLAGNVKPRVLADYRANYRRYVAEPLGSKAVGSITAADVRRWRAELMEPRPVPAHARSKGVADADAELVTLSRSTITHASTTLRRILDVAVVDGAITANPCVAVPRTRATDPDAEPFTARPLTAAEIPAVADHIGRVQGHPIYGLVVLFAAFTGLRAGELAGRNVGDLMLLQVPGSAGSVSVTRTRRAVAGGFETGTPKSVKSRRVVPIDGWLADDLRAYLANDHPHGNPASAEYDPAAPLFPGRFGRSEILPQHLSRTRSSRCDRRFWTSMRRCAKRRASRIGGTPGQIHMRLRSGVRRRTATNGQCRSTRPVSPSIIWPRRWRVWVWSTCAGTICATRSS